MNGGSQMAAVLVARGWGAPSKARYAAPFPLLALAVIIQALVVVEARPQELVTGIRGMADFIRRAVPPDFSRVPSALWPTLQTIDIALFGTLLGTILATPLAVLAAANVTPSRSAYSPHERSLVSRAPCPISSGAVICNGGRPSSISRRFGTWRAFGRNARPIVRGNHRAHGHGANHALELTGARRIRSSVTASFRRSCPPCLVSAYFVWMRIFAPRSFWVSSALVASGFN